MTYRVKTTWQALVIPDPRAELDDSTDWDTGGAVAGAPVPSGSSRMTLTTTPRTRVQADEDIEIKTQRGGMPIVSTLADPATFIWRKDGDTQALYRGYNGPHCLEQIIRIGQEAGNAKFARTSCALTPDGVVIASEATISGNDAWRTWLLAPGATVPTVADTSTNARSTRSAGFRGVPALCYTSDGRLLMYAAEDSGSTTRVALYTAGTDGTLLTHRISSVLPDLGSTVSLRRLRAAERNGQVVLFGHGVVSGATNRSDVLYQWASIDGGNSFTLVDSSPDDGAQGGGFPDVVAGGDGFLVTWIRSWAGNTDVVAVRLGSAFQVARLSPLATVRADWATSTGTPVALTRGDQALAELDDGRFVCYLADGGTSHLGTRVMVSRDRGVTWEDAGQWWWSSSSETYGPAYLYELSACGTGGMAVVIARHDPDIDTSDESITMLRFGGYSNVTNPLDLDDTQTGAGDYGGWVPFDKPEDYGFTDVDDAGISSTLGESWVVSTSTHGDSYRRKLNFAAPIWGYAMTARIGTPAAYYYSGTQGAEPHYLELNIGDATVNYRCRLGIATTGFTLYYHDGTGSVWTFIATEAVTLSVPIEVKFAIDAEDSGGGADATAKAWYRVYGGDASEPWIEVFDEACPKQTTPATVGYFAFGGTLRVGTPVEWFSLLVSNHYYGAWNAPGSLSARPYSTRALDVDDNIQIRARNGPVSTGQVFDVGTDHEFPRSALADPNPRRPWRSCDVDDQPDPIEFSWTLSTGTNAAHVPGTAVALPIIGHNVPLVTVQVVHDATTEEYNAWLGIPGVGYERRGNVVTAPRLTGHDGTSGAFVLREGELRGGTWYPSRSGQGRRIITNSAGTWSRTTVGPVPRIVLEDVDDGSDPASGAAGIIVPPNAVVFLTAGQDRQIEKVKLLLAKPDATITPIPPGGYWTIGYCVPSRAWLHADESDWNRVIETSSPTEVIDIPGNVRRTRVTGPPRRTASIAWTDGTDTTASSEVQSWATDGEPLATTGTTPWQIDALVRELDGSDQALQYVPNVTIPTGGEGDGDIVVVYRRHELVHGRLMSSVRLETVQGTEGVDEVLRLATLTIEEEV